MPLVPPLFDRIPESLLVPLASPLKALYWEALVVAYELHQAADQYEVAKETLLDRVEDHLLERETDHAALSDDSLSASNAGEEEPADFSERRLFAWRLLRQLERCGWFEYEYRRDLGAVLRFPDYASKLIAGLLETARGERPRVKGLAYNVKQILTDADEQRNDPAFVLYQARDAVAAFLRELKVLRANIGRYVEQAAEREQVRDLLALQMNEFWPKVVEPSYQQFKTSDNVLRFRMEILDRLEELANDPFFVQEAAARVEAQEHLDAEHAKARVHEWLDEMGAEIRALDELIEEIDARHARYVGLTLQRIRHRLHRNETTETRLVEMIGRLQTLPNSAEELWEDLLEAYRVQVAGEDSLYRVPAASEPHTPEPLISETVSEADRQSLLSQARETLSSPVSREIIFAEIENLLEDRGELDLADLPVADDREFLRLIALHSYRNEAAAPYGLVLDENAPPVRCGSYIFRNAHIIRRQPATETEE